VRRATRPPPNAAEVSLSTATGVHRGFPLPQEGGWFSAPDGAFAAGRSGRAPDLPPWSVLLLEAGLIASCFMESCFMESCFIESCFIESCFIESCFIESCFIESCFIESCFIESRDIA